MAKVVNKPRGTRGTLGARPYGGPELLLDLVDHCAALLEADGGLSASQARELGIKLAERVAEAWGGQQIWFPKPRPSRSGVSWFRLEARDLEIWRRYNGRNMAEVCERFNLTPAAVHLAVNRVRLERRAQLARMQPTTAGLVPPAVQASSGQLFPGPGPGTVTAASNPPPTRPESSSAPSDSATIPESA